MNKTISTIEQAQAYFQQQKDSYYFVSASNFNLMSIHNWVNNWFNVNVIDCYHGENSSVLLPEYSSAPLFENIEQMQDKQMVNNSINRQYQCHVLILQPGVRGDFSFVRCQ